MKYYVYYYLFKDCQSTLNVDWVRLLFRKYTIAETKEIKYYILYQIEVIIRESSFYFIKHSRIWSPKFYWVSDC